MAKKKKNKVDWSKRNLPKQVIRQMQAKYETVEDMQEKSKKRDEFMRKRGVLKSNAGISTAYGVLNSMKTSYDGVKKKVRKFLNITPIPMK